MSLFNSSERVLFLPDIRNIKIFYSSKFSKDHNGKKEGKALEQIFF